MKNILVPVDFSAATPPVLALAQTLGNAFNARIHLIHVREIAPLPATPLTYSALGMPEMVPAPVPEVLTQPAVPNEEEEKKLEQWRSEFARAGLEVALHKATGGVVDEIVRSGDEVKADAIIMGRHGHGAMYNLLVGSTTEGVLKRARCPVVLLPSSEAQS